MCLFEVLCCLSLPLLFVSSLYIWKSHGSRDHPSTIKRRFISVFVVMLVSPIFPYMAVYEATQHQVGLLRLLGLRTSGLIQATVIPLLLTMLLFTGPLVMQFKLGMWQLYLEPLYWKRKCQDLIWLRNHLIAPMSEEFSFRACMLPILLQCYPPLKCVFVAPLFFGIAHAHHMIERIRNGMPLKHVIFITSFQFLYTSVFGAYSAYLFLRTGHLMAPFIAHAFCNHMGFPDFSAVVQSAPPQRRILIAFFTAGLLGWSLLVGPLTDPSLYSNELPWADDVTW